MELIDTHCHLDVDAFDADRLEILQRCRAQGISRIVIPAIQSSHWNNLLDLCRNDKGLFPALGLHPVFLNHHKAQDLDALDKLVEKERPVAVGEIGLDFYIKELDQHKQIELFESQLKIASKHQLPVLLHVRKAHDQVLQSLKKIKVVGGIAHAFNGSLQQAQHYINLGFKLGFGGTLTYPGSKKIHKLAKELPLEAIVLETDAPDMVVESHRGERNSPEYILESLAALAKIRQQDKESIARQTTFNACEILGI